MNTKQSLERFERIAHEYVRQLDRYDMDQLTRIPAEGEWSLGQVYVHLINAANRMQLGNVELCRTKDPDPAANAGKSERGEAAFAAGRFPPIRVRVEPSPHYTPLQPESKEQLAAALHELAGRMRDVEPTLADIPETATVPHPAFGGLNAKEWFELVEMHFRHHLLQKERLDAFLLQPQS
ncbi:DinB family protein [Paenibacillus flagellatus]|uniref:DinB-like domain-containing protein n=1 Tax=Paenibacillus flagellatus TaxID=2211139 RepID=A0A2V5K4X1_9BACL|nr:DinB family protein [Paenibacillus flagellatus]PYI52954.1 hypothetical protein DLM86_18315 [Paenibacillus flagellatus]